jgi:hypothetical protein
VHYQCVPADKNTMDFDFFIMSISSSSTSIVCVANERVCAARRIVCSSIFFYHFGEQL